MQKRKEGVFTQYIISPFVRYYFLAPAVFLSSNTAFEFVLAYSSFGGENSISRSRSLGFNIGFQAHLGH